MVEFDDLPKEVQKRFYNSFLESLKKDYLLMGIGVPSDNQIYYEFNRKKEFTGFVRLNQFYFSIDITKFI